MQTWPNCSRSGIWALLNDSPQFFIVDLTLVCPENTGSISPHFYNPSKECQI